jgi:hypothetical protein
MQDGATAIRHIQRNAKKIKNQTPSFFVQSSAALGRLYPHLQRPRICISYSGDDMKPDRVRLPKNVLFSGREPKPDLEALETAKARQDYSHRKLDKFIAAALAELSSDDRGA